MSSGELNVITETQGDAEWLAARTGCLTASRVADAIRKSKRDPNGAYITKARQNLCMELAVERVTGKATEHFVSQWMERGTELEPIARAAYELRTDRIVETVGFVLHPSIKWAGCSPDGLVDSDGLVQFKVPKPTTHAEYLIGECVPSDYVPQMMWELACCPGRTHNVFASYCPDFKPPLDLFICRMERNDEAISAMEQEARKFLEDVEATVVRLNGGLEGALRHSLTTMNVEG